MAIDTERMPGCSLGGAGDEETRKVQLVLAAQIRQVLTGIGLGLKGKKGDNAFGKRQQARPPPSSGGGISV
ncbi:MAG: hypothetical protein Fur0022_48490 [Anaerolineales bacterium]